MGWALALLLALVGAHGVAAQSASPPVLIVSPDGPYRTIAEALAAAPEGATIEVRGGVYSGPLVIDKRVALVGVGDPPPVIDGGGRGTVVHIQAAGVRLRGFVVRNSGDDLEHEETGVLVTAPDVLVEDNQIVDVLFGIELKNAPRSIVRRNLVRGKALPVARRGDGIKLWYSEGVLLEGNRVEAARDVVLWFSPNTTLRGNTIREGRYGVHTMYLDSGRIEGNLLADNAVGAFLMYSRGLKFIGNTVTRSRGPSGYGFGLKDVDGVVARDNLIVNNHVGIYLDNSPVSLDAQGLFEGNLIAFNDVGITLLPMVQRNTFSGNTFWENVEQVHIQGGGQLRGNLWAVAGRGNFWSDYSGYDADGDGIGDLPYRAESLFEDLMSREPTLRIYLLSPAALALDLAARAFPVVKPAPKLVDPSPLMRPALPTQTLEALQANTSTQTNGWLLMTGLLLTTLAAVVAFGRRTALPETVRVAPAAPAETKAGLEVRAVTKRYGAVAALENVSFDIMPGEAVALWGPNGAGKTTLIKCLLGLVSYTGEIRLAGLDARRQGRQVRARVGYVPQEIAFHDMSVAETLAFYARLKRVGRERVDAVLAQTGLEAQVDKPVSALSGGMKQRLALAIALLADPPFLVLDEPTANLDAVGRAEFLGLVSALKRRGVTILFSSHRPEEVEALADRVIVLRAGRVVAEGLAAGFTARLGLQTGVRLRLAQP
ncbi:MAG: nitrous oxide reductase family maturation protein NosD, partial [Chloroflexota bacterium]